MSVVIETTIGDITIDLFVEERPIACLNFIKLCQLKFYNYNLFHTIERDFIAQTGDPTGVGDNGSSIWGILDGKSKRYFEAEKLPKINHNSIGLLSLVNAGENLLGSQFIFTLGPNLSSLDGIHCVIGEVVEGHDTLRKLNETIVDEKCRPYKDVRITHTTILDDPFPNPKNLILPNRSPSPSKERLQNGRIAADEDINDTDGKSYEEIQEMLAEREAKARATILEIVGDLPDADMAPPENVLFVCKLNPVTTDDDLEIIFSRFGKVKSCEVIRDKKTGDSLQYAFVEFEEQKSCEAAYFKMDNVLIDDRRIHVDFSQSVAKVKWHGKGRGVTGLEGRLDFNNLKRYKQKETRKFGKEHSPEQSFEERRIAREKRHRNQKEFEESKRTDQYPSNSRYNRDNYDRSYRNNRHNRNYNQSSNFRGRPNYEERNRRSHSKDHDQSRKYSHKNFNRNEHDERLAKDRREYNIEKERKYSKLKNSSKFVTKTKSRSAKYSDTSNSDSSSSDDSDSSTSTSSSSDNRKKHHRKTQKHQHESSNKKQIHKKKYK